MRTLVLCLGLLLATASHAQDARSLYERVGGYDVIAAVTDDFLARLGADPALSPLFRGVSSTTGRVVRQGIVDLICESAGGPCLYTGRSMADAHAGLGIDAEVWRKSVGHFTEALDAANVTGKEKGDLLAFVESLETAIVKQQP